MKIITPKELKKRLDNDEVLLIDVREPAEHRSECIEEACLIPLAELSLEKIPSKSRTIVIHCKSGKRSAAACEKLLQQDPNLDVYSLDGGIVAWQESGFSIKRTNTNILPLDRQTHLVVGLATIVGVLLGKYICPAFYIIPGITGLGLTFSGLTGWCGMSKILAKMPWNK